MSNEVISGWPFHIQVSQHKPVSKVARMDAA